MSGFFESFKEEFTKTYAESEAKRKKDTRSAADKFVEGFVDNSVNSLNPLRWIRGLSGGSSHDDPSSDE